MAEIWDIVYDNHMHLRTDGWYLDAARQFEKQGGTAFNLVNLPDHSMEASGYYEKVYSNTVSIAEAVTGNTGIKVLTTLGPYPLDYLHFRDHVDNISEFVMAGIDLAVEYIRKGKAHAIGEIGRPHFPTDEKAVEDADMILSYAMGRAADADVPVILHTEDLDSDGYAGLERMARSAGLDTGRVVKHHAYPQDLSFSSTLARSIMATRKNVRQSLEQSRNFMLETDYVDDRTKPGKVIPADSVPKRAVMVRNEYEDWESIYDSIFRKVPYDVFRHELFS